jgi:hypothetical protein
MDMIRGAIVFFSISLAFPVYADDAESIRQLRAVVDRLANEVASQELRIRNLEKGNVATPEIPGSALKNPSAPSDSLVAWRSPGSWVRLKVGMSESQVLAILGSPTSAKVLHEFKTIFYIGDVPGSGVVNGSIELKDGRVYDINVPVF